MHIVCCIKQVPDTIQVKIDPETNTLIRAGVESICNPYDLVAAKLLSGWREAWWQGQCNHNGSASSGFGLGIASLWVLIKLFVSDRLSPGRHAGYQLHPGFRYQQACTEDPVELVFCGKQAIDGDTAQVGPGIATRLGFSQLTYVTEIFSLDLTRKTISVSREVEGATQKVEAKLPVLITAELQLCIPRYASLPGLILALRHDIKVWGAADIGASPDMLGLKGSPTSVKTIFAPTPRKGGPLFDSSEGVEKAVNNFLDTLFQKESKILAEVLKPAEKE
jgi:electron transfer flavoprotein beta subunit